MGSVEPSTPVAGAGKVAHEDGVGVDLKSPRFSSTRTSGRHRGPRRISSVSIGSRSSLAAMKRRMSTPRLDMNELKLGKKLGTGAFGEVMEVESVARKLQRGVSRRISSVNRRSVVGNASVTMSKKPLGFRKKMFGLLFPKKKNKIEEKDARGKRNRYVLKRVKTQYSQVIAKDHLERAMIDFSNETKILKKLDHPNIIGLHAISSTQDNEPSSGDRFILLDRLQETLSDRMDQWVNMERRPTKRWKKKTRKGSRTDETDLVVEKLVVARDIAGALGYLHKMKIIYRDLKAENVGFDEDGTLKIFDFGLSVDVTDKNEAGTVPQTGEALYSLEGVGTPRYIAPEIARYQPYNSKVDVYAFGILVWEMLTNKTPFSGLRPDIMLKQVMKGRRPPIEAMEHFPAPLKDLVQSCWSDKISDRQDFGAIRDVLDELIKQSQA